MTFPEVLFLSLVTGGFIFIRPIVKNHWQKAYGTALAAVAVLHLLIDGYRWQMVPAYLLLLFLGWRLWQGSTGKKALWLRITGGSLLGIGLLLAWGLPLLMPVFTLPAPTGTYAVGTQWLHLTDTSREEVTTANPADKRELMVKLWYPAGSTEGRKTEPYLTDEERVALAKKYGLPAFATAHLARVRTHAYPGAVNAEEAFPVLLFSHGFGSAAGMHHAMLEEIASQGYIVAHVYHTHENVATTFPNGRTVFMNDSFAAASWTPEQIAMAKTLQQILNDPNKADKEKEAAALEWGRKSNSTAMSRRWAADLSFVLDELERMNSNQNTPFYNKLLVKQAGVFGFSIGGSAAGQALAQDQRFLAGVNWDGICYGDMVDKALQQPFMVLSADREGSAENFNPILCRNKSKEEFYYTYIKDTGHGNFSDAAYWLGYPQLSDELGGIDPDRMVSIVNQLSLAFFDHHIKGKPSRVQAISNEFAEVKTTVNIPGEQIQLTTK